MSTTTATSTEATFALDSAMIIPCDDRCMFAQGDDCDCECGGKNHKRGTMLTAAQRSIVRTSAGRRVRLLAPGTPEFDIAMQMQNLEADGYTRREIAAEFGVSAPVVRRTLRSLEATFAAAFAQAS